MSSKLNRQDLPEVERQELIRILDLPNANRFANEKDIEFLKARLDYLDESEINQFDFGGTVVDAIEAPVETEGDQTPNEFHPDELSGLTVSKLREVAADIEVDLTGVRLKADIIRVIKRAMK